MHDSRAEGKTCAWGTRERRIDIQLGDTGACDTRSAGTAEEYGDVKRERTRSLPRYLLPCHLDVALRLLAAPRHCRFGVVLIWRVPQAKYGQARQASPQRASLHRTTSAPHRFITYAAPVVPHTAWGREWPRRGAVFRVSHSGCRHRSMFSRWEQHRSRLYWQNPYQHRHTRLEPPVRAL